MCEQSLNDYITEQCALIDAALDRLLPAEDESPETIHKAMRYSIFAGGKRMRPVLCLAAAEACGGLAVDALVPACAVEMMHTYSLIHDDLPCMDNDDYRRGRLTNHKVFGEANAVLAGDALLTAAFETAANAPADAWTIVRIIRILSETAGANGMVGGQVLDLAGEKIRLEADAIHTIHALKTGALISAACRMGAAAAGAGEKEIRAADAYAKALGLAFQLRDDMLDVLGDAEKMGKATGMDGSKNTFVSLYGVGECSKMIERYTDEAIDALADFTDTEFLAELAQRLALREF